MDDLVKCAEANSGKYLTWGAKTRKQANEMIANSSRLEIEDWKRKNKREVEEVKRYQDKRFISFFFLVIRLPEK